MTVNINNFIIKAYKHILSYKSLISSRNSYYREKSLFRTPETSQCKDAVNSHYHHHQLQRERVSCRWFYGKHRLRVQPWSPSIFNTAQVFRENQVSFSRHHHHEAPGSVLSNLYLLTLFILTRIL